LSPTMDKLKDQGGKAGDKGKEKPRERTKAVNGTHRKTSQGSTRPLSSPKPSRTPSARTHTSTNSLDLVRSRTSLEYDSASSRSLSGASSDEGGEDEDDMHLDLREDDIPVTGFAVASSKRNADFHELFKTIPEGDYLIEGRPLVVVWVTPELIGSRRLWVCNSTGNLGSRETVYFREPYLFPCEYFWLGDRRTSPSSLCQPLH